MILLASGGIYWRYRTWQDDGLPVTISQQLGIDALAAKLGDDIPTGRGIVIGHVESRQSNDYMPAVKASRFQGVNFRANSGSSGISGHASATATVIYGPKGLAPGVKQVECYATDHWLGDGMLHLGDDRTSHAAFPVRIFTHSWISYDLPREDELLMRVDELIDEQGVVVVAGVNNGSLTPVPTALASAHNVIAVGEWHGHSSQGYTTSAAPPAGRSKPELVAPGGMTSFATPAVTALVARLMEVADKQEIDRSAQPLVIKAVLLAGTDKPDDWQPKAGHPLDDRYGAGRPRLDVSYEMLMNPLEGKPPSLMGWDHRLIYPGHAMTYRLLAHQPLKELTLALVWHRRVSSSVAPMRFGRGLQRTFEARKADLHLVLLRSDQQPVQMLAASTSVIDNVQYIHIRDLPAGRYDLMVSRQDHLDESWNYALAWRAVEAEAKPSSRQ